MAADGRGGRSAAGAEFTAIILPDGKANALYPLTEEAPLALLPVANRPLISYQLESLVRVGFKSVIIAVARAHAKKVHHAVEHQLLLLALDPASLQDKLTVSYEILEEEAGSATVLRGLADRIKTDFIVLGGDSICDLSLHVLADMHRLRKATLTLAAAKHVAPSADGAAAVKKKKQGPSDDESSQADVIGIAAGTDRVVFIAPLDDVENETVHMRHSLLRHVPAVALATDLADANVYVFSRWVLDLLVERPAFVSIKDELVPYLINKQFRLRTLKRLIHLVAAPDEGEEPGTDRRGDELAFESQSYAGAAASASAAAAAALDPLFLRCHIVAPGVFLSRRVTSLAAYLAVNRELARPGASRFSPHEPLLDKGPYCDPSARVSPRTQIGPECCVGKDTTIGDRCSVKKSNIGAHVTLGTGVKLTNCVVMDGAVVRDRAKLTNVVVCAGARVLEDCSLKDSTVAGGAVVPEGTDAANTVYKAA